MIKIIILLIAAVSMVVGTQIGNFYLLLISIILFIITLLLESGPSNLNERKSINNQYDKKMLSPLKNMFSSFQEISKETKIISKKNIIKEDVEDNPNTIEKDLDSLDDNDKLDLEK